MVILRTMARCLCTVIALLWLIPLSTSSATHGPDSQGSGLKLIKLSTIVEPAWAMGNEAGVLVHKNFLYIPLGYPGLSVYDIHDPRSPLQVARLRSEELGGQAGAMAASGGRLFLALPDAKTFAMLDISDPSSPHVLEWFGNFWDIGQVGTAGGYFYSQTMGSISYLGGLQIYDISGLSPELRGEHPLKLVDPGFFVSDTGHVFLARTPATMNDSAKIDSIDTTDPAVPVLIDQWESTYPGNITDIHFLDGKLFCSAYWGGIWILDASDLSSIIEETYYDWEDRASVGLSLRAFPPYIIVAQGGPQQAHEKFGVYRYSGDSLRLEAEIPVAEGSRTHSVYLRDNLLILTAFEDPWSDATPEKTVTLYRLKTGKPKLTISASTGGTTVPAPGTYRYSEAKSVLITAMPDPHFSFDHWSGGATGNFNPLVIEVNTDINIQANFRREIYPPVNASGERKVNRSLFFREYIDILSWQENPANERIEKYRVYELLQNRQIFLGETDARTRTYWHKGIDGHRAYSYAIASVNEMGREGRAAIVTIESGR